jgi:hypothetical protein
VNARTTLTDRSFAFKIDVTTGDMTVPETKRRPSMRAKASTLAASLILLASCSSGSSGTPGDGSSSGGSSGGPTVTEHGVVYDYGTLLATGNLVTVEGLTITDNGLTATTDVNGNWSLTVPLSSTMQPIVTGTSKGDPYSYLMLPAATAAGTDLDWGNIITPDVSTFQLERVTLGSDDTQAVMHAVVLTTGSCTSVAGGTLTVTSPPGAKVNYFDQQGYPRAGQSAFIDPPVSRRPVADIYDVAPGTNITFQISHPTCHQAPFPVTNGGATLTGQVVTKAAEPGDNNSALVVVLE